MAVDLREIEYGRLVEAADGGVPPDGMWLRKFVGFASEEPEAVSADTILARSREVLRIVNENSLNWPSDSRWRDLLPRWFIDECRPEYSPQEADAELRLFHAMPAELQYDFIANMRWTMSNWLAYFRPDARQWYWWSSEDIDSVVFRVFVLVDSEPFPSGALDWLLRASGADSVSSS